MAISDIAKRNSEGKPPWRKCFTCDALDNLPKSEAKALADLLANPRVRYTDLSRELAADEDNPLHIDSYNLGRHARGQCEREKAKRRAAK